jgi:hypothetical protein
MTDLSTTIAAKSDQMNADDLIGRSLTIKITKVSKVQGDQPIAINYEGDENKPYKPCKSMRRVLVFIWGSDGNAYVGRSMTLFRDEAVRFGPEAVGGVRISHMSHINKDETVALTVSRGHRKPFTVKPLKVAGAAAAAPAISPEVKKAGEEAAEQGVEVYTAWVAGLSADVKPTVRPFHTAWTAKAKEADTQATITTEPAKEGACATCGGAGEFMGDPCADCQGG